MKMMPAALQGLWGLNNKMHIKHQHIAVVANNDDDDDNDDDDIRNVTLRELKCKG